METEQLVEIRKEMSHLNDQLKEQIEHLKPDFKEGLSLEQNSLVSAIKRHLGEL